MPQRPLKPCSAPACAELVRGKRFCDKHKDREKLDQRTQGSRWGKGRGGRPWRRKRDNVLRRDQYLCRCEECTRMGRLRIAHEVDHIVPLSRGGPDHEGNLRAINRDCHKDKTARESKG